MEKFEKQLFELKNYLQIKKACEIAKEDSKFFIIAGETGTGKTEGLVNFSKRDKECNKYVRLRKSMTTSDLFSEIAQAYGYSYSYKTLHRFMNWISIYLNEDNKKHLLIIDEGGMLTPDQLGLIHELRDLTEDNLGIVLAGPKYFVENLRIWNSNQKRGVPEFFRRVNLIIPLENLTKAEILGVCEAYKITSIKDINKEFINIKSIGDLTNTIQNYLYYQKELFI